MASTDRTFFVGVGTTIAFTVRMQLQDGVIRGHETMEAGSVTLVESPTAWSSALLQRNLMNAASQKLCLPHIDGARLRVIIMVRNDALSKWLKKTIKRWGAKCKRIKGSKVLRAADGEASDDDSDDRQTRRNGTKDNWTDLLLKYRRGWAFDTILADYVLRQRVKQNQARSDESNESDNFDLGDDSDSDVRDVEGPGGKTRTRRSRNRPSNPTTLHAVYFINFEERITIAKQGHQDIEVAGDNQRQSVKIMEHFCPKPIKLRYLFQQLQTIATALDRHATSLPLPEDLLKRSDWNTEPRSTARRRKSGSHATTPKELSPPTVRTADSGADSQGETHEPVALVVEDNKLNQKVIGAMLKKLRVEHDFADNGEDCLQVLADSARHYDIIFMDVQVPQHFLPCWRERGLSNHLLQMPVMDGLEAARRIRKREASGELPDPRRMIVGLTACAMKEDRDACLRAGMDYYLSKPVKLEGLKELIDRVRDTM